MTVFRRLMAVGAVLSLAAFLTCTQVWGEPKRDKEVDRLPKVGKEPARPVGELDKLLGERLAKSRFAGRPVVLYTSEAGETYFAIQGQPKLADAPARPRDYLVMVDTSASKAGGDLATAQDIVKKLAGKLGKEDKLALWTVNLESHDLTHGFLAPDKLAGALKELDREVPLGAVDLKSAMTKAVDAFAGVKEAGRQRVLIYLGDGKSVAGPVTAADRAELCGKFAKDEVAVFTVPLGPRLEPQNLHGFVNGTGGKCVRLAPPVPAKPLAPAPSITAQTVTDLLAAVAEPILYDSELKLPAEVTEVFPVKLPPLRRDTPTLVVGKIKPGKTLDYTLSGKVAGKDVRLEVSEKLPAAEVTNFFLVNLVAQWREAKDRPALIRADRALAFAFEHHEMARADLLAKADWALEKDKFEAALRLFKDALKVDPHSDEAKAGIKAIERMRFKKMTKAEMREMLKLKPGDKLVRVDGDGKPRAVKPDDPLAPPEGPKDILADVKARRAVADQQATLLVNDAIRKANRAVQSDPDDAVAYLKRIRDDVQNNPDITERTRVALAERLSRTLQGLNRVGAVVKRNQAEDLRARADADERLALRGQETLMQDRIRERMRVFHNLMDQAREQEAYQRAQDLRVDLINQGLPVPQAVTAGYQIGLAGYHLRELQELKRLREERWLAVMLSVEKSHVPFPDEPPVEFPKAAVWKRLTDLRKDRYESSGFGVETPKRAFELRKALAEPIRFEGLDVPTATLAEALDLLAKKNKRFGLTFDINEKAFKFEGLMDVQKTPVGDPPLPAMENVALGTVLRKILSRVVVPSGTTYIIRRDHIEITTGQFAVAEKAVRVYPVADLVTPIPNSFNTSAVGRQAALFGLTAGGLGALGGGLGRLGGLGALGGGLGRLGGLGAIGAIGGGAVGVAGAGALGGGFNQLGANGGGARGNFQGGVNLGVGGGVVGFGGGQLGQLGNLGGQFGLQGGTQSNILIQVIYQTVGNFKKDWAPPFDPTGGGGEANPLDDPGGEATTMDKELNQLGFYPPAMALVVKGSATIHNRASNVIVAPGAMGAGGMGALPVGRDPVALGKKDPRVRVAPDGDERPDPSGKKKKKKRGPPPDPKKVWQEALAKGVTDPALIIATADFLATHGYFDHVAEFLKANLRQGIVIKPWVYKSLAIALRESGASPEEIERAEMSAADLQPLDAPGYLQAAKALAADKNYTRALAFCRQAAILMPNVPYAYEEALGYAELAQDGKAMEWAAGRLLRQDWPVKNQQMQTKARQKLAALAAVLRKADRADEADRLLAAVQGQRRRDLVIQLRWQGQADLDLHVREPGGSVCSHLSRQSVGGGTWVGDTLGDDETPAETYAAAQGFSGVYEVTVDAVWGRPLGGKAQLKVITHQGTPEEHEQLITVDLKAQSRAPILVRLDGGRRTEAAYVPPPSALRPPEPPASLSGGPNQVLNKLRMLSDPEAARYQHGLRGSAHTTGRQTSSADGARPPSPLDRPVYQTRVAPVFTNSVSVTAQATISADRRYVRLSLSPVFNTVRDVVPIPVLGANPVIPGIR